MSPATPMLRAGALLAFALVCLPLPASAQFGSIKKHIKEKVAEKTAEKAVGKVLGEEEAAAAPSPAAPTSAPRGAAPADRTGTASPAERRSPYGSYVLEITPEVGDRLAAALAAEEAERRSIPERKRAHEQASQKHSACYMEVMTSEEMEKVNERQAAAGEANDPEAAQKALADQQAMFNAKCGESPAIPDYGRAAKEKALAAGGFTDMQYAILKERIIPFCRVDAQRTPDGEGVRIGGPRIAYVYSSTEVRVLQERCEALGKAINAVM